LHGMIFVELKKYAEARIGADAWRALLREAGLGAKVFLMIEAYDDADATKLVAATARLMAKEPAQVLEDFGDFVVPDLMAIYGALAQPGWRTLDLLEHVENTVHRVVRLRSPGAKPPEIRCTRDSKAVARIVYTSPRRMCAFARGLVVGVARYYGEDVRIVEPSCMLRGDPHCEIVVEIAGT
jgi:predicted hydrocarbon binding protein